MSYHEHDDAIRTMLRRARILSVDDSGDAQLVNLAGLREDRPQKVVAIHQHGFSSNPLPDGEGIMKALGGRSDRLLWLGGEHKDARPKNLQQGEATLYDDQGQRIHVQRNGVRHPVKAHSVVVSDGLAKHRIQPNGFHVVETDDISKLRFIINGSPFQLSPTALVPSTMPPPDPTRAG